MGKILVFINLSNYSVLAEANSTSTPLTVIDNPDIDIQTLTVRQAATFYGAFYVYGEAGFMHKVVFEKDIEVKGKIYASADQAGTATILANVTSTEVVFTSEYETVPKVIANLSDDSEDTFINWKIAKKTVQGFRIVLQTPIDRDLTFDCIAFAVKDQTQPTNNIVLGCLDQTAINYNPSANTEDGSCQYPAPPSSGGDGSITTEPPAEEPPTEEPIVTPPPAEEPIVAETPATTPTEPPAETPVTDNTLTTPSPVDTAGVGGDDWTLVN